MRYRRGLQNCSLQILAPSERANPAAKRPLSSNDAV